MKPRRWFSGPILQQWRFMAACGDFSGPFFTFPRIRFFVAPPDKPFYPWEVKDRWRLRNDWGLPYSVAMFWENDHHPEHARSEAFRLCDVLNRREHEKMRSDVSC